MANYHHFVGPDREDGQGHQFCKAQNIADPPKFHPTSEELKVYKAQALAKFGRAVKAFCFQHVVILQSVEPGD